MAQFAPNTNIAQGSPISAALLNGLVQAQGYVQSGGAPPTSASLVVTMPATQAVVPIAGGLSVWVSMASGALPALTASHDSYIDLVSTTSYPYTGSYVVAGVANGASAPAVAANGLRLCKVVTSGSAATAVTLLASMTPGGAHALYTGPTPTVVSQNGTTGLSVAGTDTRGLISWIASAGSASPYFLQAFLLFATPYGTAPVVQLTPDFLADPPIPVTTSGVGTTGFFVSAMDVAPVNGGVYQVAYHVIG